MNAFVTHLGSEYPRLDALVKKVHIGQIRLDGNVSVRRGNRFASLLCDALGMPPAAASVGLTVIGTHLPDRMQWERDFGGVTMRSCFVLDGDYLVEKMGPVSLWMKLVCPDGRLQYRLIKAGIWGMPLPAMLSPTLEAFETEEDGFYRFRVAVGLPFIGRLIEYEGRMTLQSLQGDR